MERGDGAILVRDILSTAEPDGAAELLDRTGTATYYDACASWLGDGKKYPKAARLSGREHEGKEEKRNEH